MSNREETYLTSPPVKFWYRSLNSLCNIVRKNTRAMEQMPNPEVLGNSTARGRELSMDFSHKSLGGRRRPVEIKGLVSVRSRGFSCEFLVGVYQSDLQILTLFQTKKCHFSHPFSDLASKIHSHSQNWPLRNYVIIT